MKKNKYMTLEDIRIRDPFFLKDENTYYLYGSTDKNTWQGKGTGFDYYKSRDLKNYLGPYPAFRPPEGFWADENFWAPEVWEYRGGYYLIAAFKKGGMNRGVQILYADSPGGPFLPFFNKPHTPKDWACLDGTLYFERGVPYLIFCHEWTQISDGAICAVPLSEDLSVVAGKPFVLFHASSSAWTREHFEFGHRGYVTDGPFLFNSNKGLHMIWSSFSKEGYAIGVSYSPSGLLGEWVHADVPLYHKDGGHGMIFRGIKNELLLAMHSPNELMKERVRLFPLEVAGEVLQLL